MWPRVSLLVAPELVGNLGRKRGWQDSTMLASREAAPALVSAQPAVPAILGVVLPHVLDEMSLLQAFMSWRSRDVFGSVK